MNSVHDYMRMGLYPTYVCEADAGYVFTYDT
jgi:hypothetical protein